MQTETINTTTDTEVFQEQEVTLSKLFNFSLDGNLGIQMAFMGGLVVLLYYLFSFTCPPWLVYMPTYGDNGDKSELISKEG